MSRKHFSWLLLATVIVAVLVLFFPGRTGNEASREETLLIPGLAGQVNGIDWLRISSGEGTIVTLSRSGSTWVVEEASSYRADWDQVKNLLASLARAEVVEPKTSNPDLYSKLGVEDLGAPGAAGVRIDFAESAGLPAVIVGNLAQGREGQYARLADAAGSVLFEPALDLSREQSGWLDRGIIDISDAEVVEYEIVHPGGDTVRALKASADDENFALQDVPAGRKVKSDWNVNAPANALAALELEAVVPDTQMDWDGATRFRILTADGLTADVEVISVESETGSEADGGQPERWIRIQAGAYAGSDDAGAGEEPASAETLERAEAINGRVRGWAYRVPAYRSDSMTRSMDDLLQPAGDDNEPPAL